jgi:hypothetical protein
MQPAYCREINEELAKDLGTHVIVRQYYEVKKGIDPLKSKLV